MPGSSAAEWGGRRRPAPGTTFAGEGLTAEQSTGLQNSVNGGRQPWRLDRVQVAKSFVQGRFGWISVQTSIVTGGDRLLGPPR
ncbi:hypothetical protein KO481_40215 [Nocardia sp. NEAU-G5]|uniref:Uncharacterized protein n=1 Tax=Nocardia albiluteola TaxID=2842303 RepID=A0ABS6BBS0_9NOCA|nr:hypothetical protein [Nocardia albiluteola]MBU3067732.1 hypothetical protein [Nocardia albiluteola]